MRFSFITVSARARRSLRAFYQATDDQGERIIDHLGVAICVIGIFILLWAAR